MNWFIFLKNIIGDDMKKLVLIFVCLLLVGCDKNIEQANINVDKNMHGYYGYLIIPEIKMKLGFYDLDSKENNVNKNVMLINSNIDNTYILAAHSGSGRLAYFNDLRYLDVNDDIYLRFQNEEKHYKVTNIRKVIKNGKISIKNEENQIILTTCDQIKKGYQLIIEGSLIN